MPECKTAGGCTGLKSADFHGNVTLGAQAFYNCRSLETVTLDISAIALEKAVFQNCIRLTGISLPDSVAQIGYDCFRNCIALETVTAAGVEVLNSSCFANCSGLKSLRLGAALGEIQSDVFLHCGKLEQVVYGGTVSDWAAVSFSEASSSPFCDSRYAKLIIGGEPVTVAEFDETLTAINPYSFYGYSTLEKVVFSDTIEKTGKYAFAYCEKLKQVALSDSVTELGVCTFYNCTGLKKIDLNHVEVLDSSVFNGCTGLEAVIGFDHLTQIGYKAFSECGRLRSLPLGESLRIIEDYAFQYCTGLEAVTIPQRRGNHRQQYLPQLRKPSHGGDFRSMVQSYPSDFGHLYSGTGDLHRSPHGMTPPISQKTQASAAPAGFCGGGFRGISAKWLLISVPI